jgi:2-dehydropantoate 2-reductase
MRIVVAGAGQIGSLIGAALAENGNEVELYDTNPQLVEALNQNGLTIERRDGRVDRYAVKATLEPGSTCDGPADLVLVQVKGFATRAAAEKLRAVVDGHSSVLTLQNGLGNEQVLREVLPGNEIFIGMTTHTVVTQGVGQYLHTGMRETFLGPSRGDDLAQAEVIAAAIRRDDFPVTVNREGQIRVQQWGKFVANCAVLPVSALTRLRIDLLIRQQPLYDLMDAIVREACAIAAAEGVALDPEGQVAFLHDLLDRAGGRASMLGDVLAGRRTEVDTINGAAITFADRHGISAPLNRAMSALVGGLDLSIAMAEP